MAVSNALVVGMAEIKVVKGSNRLTCLGLGCSIGLVAFDPETNVCGTLHFMLPESFKDKPLSKPEKFADTGITSLIEALEDMGTQKERLVFAYAGGSQLFCANGSPGSKLDIGTRNAEAVSYQLSKINANVVASEVGGTSGRSMSIDTATGEVSVKTIQGAERTLCYLKN